MRPEGREEERGSREARSLWIRIDLIYAGSRLPFIPSIISSMTSLHRTLHLSAETKCLLPRSDAHMLSESLRISAHPESQQVQSLLSPSAPPWLPSTGQSLAALIAATTAGLEQAD